MLFVKSLDSDDKLLRKYERLNEVAKKSTRYQSFSTYSATAAFLISLPLLAAVLVLIEPENAESTSTLSKEYQIILSTVFGIAFVVSVALAAAFRIKSARLKIEKEEERIGVSIYRAYRAVDNFIDSNVPEHQKEAKRRLQKLVDKISLWRGNAPAGLYQSIDELAKSMNDKLVQIIKNSKNIQEISSVRTFLHTFLEAVNDTGINWNTIDIIINQLKSITTPESTEVPKLEKQLLKHFSSLKYALIITIVFGALFYIAITVSGVPYGFALAFTVPPCVVMFWGFANFFRKKLVSE